MIVLSCSFDHSTVKAYLQARDWGLWRFRSAQPFSRAFSLLSSMNYTFSIWDIHAEQQLVWKSLICSDQLNNNLVYAQQPQYTALGQYSSCIENGHFQHWGKWQSFNRATPQLAQFAVITSLSCVELAENALSHCRTLDTHFKHQMTQYYPRKCVFGFFFV